MAPLNKAVILARGLGTRMQREDTAACLSPSQSAMADSGMKAMISVGRPFLDYVLSGLANVGFGSVCLVIGPEHEAIREYYSRQDLRRLQLHLAIQTEPRGTADALLSAAAFVESDDFIVLNSDNYYPPDALLKLRQLGSLGTVMFPEQSLVHNSNIPIERVRHFAYAKVDAHGFLADLIEKPVEAEPIPPVDVLVSMNCWRFSPEIFKFCRSIPLSPRGEYELTSAVVDAVRSGMQLRVLTSDAGVLDLSVRADISAVTAYLEGVEVSL